MALLRLLAHRSKPRGSRPGTKTESETSTLAVSKLVAVAVAARQPQLAHDEGQSVALMLVMRIMPSSKPSENSDTGDVSLPAGVFNADDDHSTSLHNDVLSVLAHCCRKVWRTTKAQALPTEDAEDDTRTRMKGSPESVRKFSAADVTAGEDRDSQPNLRTGVKRKSGNAVVPAEEENQISSMTEL